MVSLQNLSAADIHMNTARQAGVEAADRPHDVDAFKFIWTVFLKYGRVLDRIFIRSGGPVNVAWTRIPRCRRIGMVVGDLPLFDDDMMRKDTADGLMESTRDRLVGHLEWSPRFIVAGADFIQGLLAEVERGRSGVMPESRSGRDRVRWHCSISEYAIPIPSPAEVLFSAD